MKCNICGRNLCVPRCPNYIEPKPTCYCFICGEGIYEGEEYVENSGGQYVHWDCTDTVYDLAEFLDIEIKTMGK